MHVVFQRLAICLLAILITTISAAATNWNGDWNSSFGQLRLLQNGDRLYGDYQERGVIEGRISPDGRNARAVFVYNDGRWGTIQWRIANDRISGTWSWSQNGIAEPKNGNSWTATRTSARTSPLKYADQFAEKYPTGDPNFTEAGVGDWVDEIAGRVSPNPPNIGPGARDGLSALYGGYALSNIEPAYDIDVEVIHYRGSNTADVDISIFVNPGQACPRAMHTAFCAELASLADSRGDVDVTTTGVAIVNLGNIGETIEATFRLPGDRRDRLIRLRREATYFSGFIHHPRRGYDYEGFAVGRPHLCEQAQCLDEIFEDVRDNPQRFRGNVDRGYIVAMLNRPNNIAQSHRGVRPQPQPQPQPAPAPGPGPRPLLTDAWVILEETNENLGEISFSPDGGRLAASGVLRSFFETGDDHDTVFTFAGSTGEAVSFDLVTYAGQSGESKTGRLIVELPSYATNNPRGSLIVGDEVLLIELARPIPGVDPSDVGDTPAIGIYSVNYRLRDVPLDRSVRLRQEPNRSSGTVGGISPNARQLQLLNCTGNINAQRFQDASFDGKMALLSASWCQVTNGQLAGWLPGRYLVPETN